MRSGRTWLGIVVLAASAAGLGTTAAAPATIEGELRERLDAGLTADFVVRFAEQANLSAAFQMDWQGRGEFVFGKLREVAERSQAAARAILDARGVSYQPFLAGNEIYVRAGDAALATALAARAEVAVIRAPREAAVAAIIEAPRPEGGGVGKIYFAVQAESAPPAFVLSVNEPKFFARHYLRYINNRIREEYGFSGCRIFVKLKRH